MTIITEHAYERARQRLGADRAQTKRLVELAYEHGKTVEDFSGATRKWLDNAMKNQHHRANVICVLDGCAYFFSGETCLTIIPIPKEMAA